MNLKDILARIDPIRLRLGLSDAHLSEEVSGSPDLIRNWRRRLAKGEAAAGASYNSLAKIAEYLDVDERWLIDGAYSSRTANFAVGDVSLFAPQPASNSALVPTPMQIGRAIATDVERMQIFELKRDFPSLSLLSGDMLAVDNEPVGGTFSMGIVVVDFDELPDGNRLLLLRRLSLPWLITLDPGDPHPVLEVTDSRTQILGNVEAMWRRKV